MGANWREEKNAEIGVGNGEVKIRRRLLGLCRDMAGWEGGASTFLSKGGAQLGVGGGLGWWGVTGYVAAGGLLCDRNVAAPLGGDGGVRSIDIPVERGERSSGWGAGWVGGV